MAKPTFQPRDRKGKLMSAIEYTPLIYIAGTETHRFALHRNLTSAMRQDMKDWHVSELATGMHVRTVRSSYKGMPCSSRGLTLAAARRAAMATLDEFLESIGSDMFNKTIAKAQAKWAGETA